MGIFTDDEPQDEALQEPQGRIFTSQELRARGLAGPGGEIMPPPEQAVPVPKRTINPSYAGGAASTYDRPRQPERTGFFDSWANAGQQTGILPAARLLYPFLSGEGAHEQIVHGLDLLQPGAKAKGVPWTWGDAVSIAGGVIGGAGVAVPNLSELIGASPLPGMLSSRAKYAAGAPFREYAALDTASSPFPFGIPEVSGGSGRRDTYRAAQEMARQALAQRALKDAAAVAGMDVNPAAAKAVQELTKFIHSPESVDLAKLTIETRRAQLSQRLQALQSRTEELLKGGTNIETALKQAQRETMSGAFDRPMATLSESMATQFREAAFQRVYAILKDDPVERMGTVEALTNALAGKGIPRIAGTKGGSAYTRLSRIFPPETLAALENKQPIGKVFDDLLAQIMIEKNGPARGVPGLPEPRIPGALHEEPLGEQVPLSISEQGGASSELPRMTAQEQAKKTLALKLDLGGKPTGVGGLGEPPPVPPPPGGKPPVVKQEMLMPPEHENRLIGALKYAGLTVMDIGNAIRSNISSTIGPDASWWRQNSKMILNNPRPFIEGNVASWRATWGKGAAAFAEQSERNIKTSRYYPLYEKWAQEGADFLRPLSQKGVEAWKREENFMVLGSERPIPKFMEKLPWIRFSQRSFVTGVNEMNWQMFTKFMDDSFARNEAFAAGTQKMPNGWSIEKSGQAYAGMLADMTGRASLKLSKDIDASSLSPALNAGFFAIRNTLGQIKSPFHLVNADPFVRTEAWKNIISYVGTVSGVVYAGEQTGIWHTEHDPNSASFMKIRVAGHWFDPWFGHQQYAVFLARMRSGEVKSAKTGRAFDSSRMEILGRFLQGKGSPTVGFATDVISGKTYTGQETDLLSAEQWFQRVGPSTITNLDSALRQDGLSPAVAAVGAFSTVGGGVGTFPYKIGELNQKWEKAVDTYNSIPGEPAEAKARKMQTRGELLAKDPQMDAKMFVLGYTEALHHPASQAEVVRLMKAEGVKVTDIDSLAPTLFEPIEHAALRYSLETALGQSHTMLKDVNPQMFAFGKLLADTGYLEIEGKYLSKFGPSVNADYQKYQRLPDERARKLAFDAADLQLMKNIDASIAAQEKAVRLASEDLDVGLVEYGFGGTPETPAGRTAKFVADREAAKKAG